ncbi:MAG: glycoside hydrolase family 78 protein [Pirellulales bacterium]|nr:glycoside hydrolase family 78 protein [Pirellulales bacterium]
MKTQITLCLLLGIFGASNASRAEGLSVERPRCEYLVDPIGMDVARPRLSWELTSDERGQRQTAYRVLVASSPEILAEDRGDLWDSGRVDSDGTIHVEYAGNPLVAFQRCHWKVRAWDKQGRPSPWSRPAFWSVGVLGKADWGAKWISHPAHTPKSRPKGTPPETGSILVRKPFSLPDKIRRVTVYVTGLGMYELRINGRRVGDQLLAPEWTDYRKRIPYQAYDVTDLVKPGENAVGAMLGAGWQMSPIFLGRFFGNERMRLLMRLEIELADGTRQVIATDESWRASDRSPVVDATIYNGETYDARREQPGWDKAGFNDSDWVACETEPLGKDDALPRLVRQRNEPIRVTEELKPKNISEPQPGVFIFDMGQNMVGWVRLKVRGPAGTTVRVRHAEMLNDDGTLYTANLRRAKQTAQYTLQGDGEKTFEPHFTYMGFRYVELTGMPERPTKESIVGRVFHSSAPRAGQFECSDERINRILHCAEWGLRGNLMSIPTDCPQRDERLGWMGDIQIFTQTAMFQHDMAGFFSKWVPDVRDAQRPDGRFTSFAPDPGDGQPAIPGVPGWADAGTIVPWRQYQNYADRRMLAEHFDAARRWVDWIHAQNPDLIFRKGRGNDYGDWLNADRWSVKGMPRRGANVPKDLLGTAFFAHSTQIVAKMAAVLGKESEAKEYEKLFERIRAAFQREYVKPDGTIAGDTQAGYALALRFDLLPEASRPTAAKRMVAGLARYKGHLSTGFQTTVGFLLEASRHGAVDEAYRLVQLREPPSWGAMIDNGATTIWERWDGYVKGRGFQKSSMNSFNHYAFGSVGEWMWRVIAGINLDESQPGYKHIVLRPRPGGDLTWAKGSYHSIRGPIESHWTRKGKRLTWRVAIPANTTATVHVPTTQPASVQESGRPAVESPGVKFLRNEVDAAVYSVESGRYEFTAEY